MKAMQLQHLSNLSLQSLPLEAVELPIPTPDPDEVLIKVSACGVCHTELDEIEGRLLPRLPIIPGHQVIGHIVAMGKDCRQFKEGDRVGVAWIFSSCGECEFCLNHKENLCPNFYATGKDRHGGYAEYMTVPESFVHPIPAVFSDTEAAPLLCAGAIGYRSLRLTGLQDGDSLGLTGFGASAHLVLKMVRHRYPNSQVFVFARKQEEQAFARQLGAAWAGHTKDEPPQKLNAIIDTTPAWLPVVTAMSYLKPGGRLVINAIRKEETDKTVLQDLDYPSQLWQEKEIKSVANVTRKDVREFLTLAADIPIKPKVETYPLSEANQALMDLKHKHIHGAKVLVVS